MISAFKRFLKTERRRFTRMQLGKPIDRPIYLANCVPPNEVARLGLFLPNSRKMHDHFDGFLHVLGGNALMSCSGRPTIRVIKRDSQVESAKFPKKAKFRRYIAYSDIYRAISRLRDGGTQSAPVGRDGYLSRSIASDPREDGYPMFAGSQGLFRLVYAYCAIRRQDDGDVHGLQVNTEVC